MDVKGLLKLKRETLLIKYRSGKNSLEGVKSQTIDYRTEKVVFRYVGRKDLLE